MGESIVFIIKGDDEILFSGVIDCFETEEKNITLSLLKENNIQNLDFVCLTHPDEDHSKGLEKILEKTSSETYIIYPHNLLMDNNNYVGGTQETVKRISEYIAMRQNNKNKNNRIKACSGKKSIIEEDDITFVNLKNNYRYPLIINTYTPISEIIDRYWAKQKLNKKSRSTTHNQLSIVTAIAVGDFKMLLCGDVQNDTLKIWKTEWKRKDYIFFSGVLDYLKIPHHTSNRIGFINRFIGKHKINF